MTDLSPYQITSAKSAPVMPPKVQATQSARPYYACDMSKIPAQQALRFELELAAAWKASAQAEHHRAAVPQFVEGSGLRKDISQPDAVIKAKPAKLDRYNGIPLTIRGVEYPSYNAAAAELGISPQTVYWHFNRGTLDTCGLGTGWKVTPTVGDDGKVYPSISKAAKASGISKQAMAGRKKVKA